MFTFILYVLVALLLVVRITRYFCLGAVAGGTIGFLLRPSVTIVGQLPLEVVLTRGSNLRGIEAVYKSAAETSFNYVLAGALIGGVAGLALVVVVNALRRPAQVTSASAGPGSTKTPQQATPPLSRFCSNCGAAVPSGTNYCGACGNKQTSA